MKYKVTVGTLFVDGVKYKRGDIVETDQELGTRAEPVPEIEAPKPKPKRKRRTKAEIAQDALSAAQIDIPKFGGEDIA